MYCKKCGTQNDDNAFKCVKCGEVLQSAASQVAVPNYLVQSILVTLLCCMPFGIPAIVFASQVNSKLAAGDVPGAMDASKKAKMWSWISFGLGLAVNILIVIYYVVIIGFAAASAAAS